VNSGTRPTSGSLPKSTRSDVTVVGLRFAQDGASFVFRQPLASPSHLISLDEARKPSEGLYQVAIDWNRICWSSTNRKTPDFTSLLAVMADAPPFLSSAVSRSVACAGPLLGSSDCVPTQTILRYELARASFYWEAAARDEGLKRLADLNFQLRRVLESAPPVSPNPKPERAGVSLMPSLWPSALLLAPFEPPLMSRLLPLVPYDVQFDMILHRFGGQNSLSAVKFWL
jgi:hypothetical protein